MTISRRTLSLPGLALAAALLAPSLALAEETEVAQCAAKWIAAKENPKFYQPWGDYFNDCKKKLAEAATPTKAEEAKPAAEPEATKAEAAKPEPTPVAVPAPKPAPAPAAAPAPAPAPAAEPAKHGKPAHKAKKPAQNKPAAH
jgi:outer membrane biosynthesis protein TonB